jgi:hypothetical protein
LRDDLLRGDLTPQLLVNLTPEDLATEDLRKARQREGSYERDARRTDWMEENKERIQAKIGLDPKNVWEFEAEVESDPD